MWHWRYRCGTCSSTSLPFRTRTEALAARDRHRDRVHGGLVPDGEQLLRKRAGPSHGDAGPGIVLVILAGLILLAWITQH